MWDEFGLLVDNAAEAGLPWHGAPAVARCSVEVEGGHRVSVLSWGETDPELVLLHGGAQNAHTWDTVALALARPLIAVDLPGHGRSDWRDDHDYSPRINALAVETVVRALAPRARMIVGMSLGGLTALALARRAPELVRRLVMVDVTPGTDREKAEPIVAFVAGPESFPSFDELLARTIEFNPTRSESSLRRGILHNAYEREDGSWAWRYDRTWGGEIGQHTGFSPQWDDVDALEAPALLVRGSESGVVGDEDVAEFQRRHANLRIEVVDGAGHSVQGDRPVELARLLDGFLGEDETSGA